MPATYHAPVPDTRFVLKHVVGLPSLAGLPAFREASAEMVAAILDEGAKFVEGVVAPLNQPGDLQGCTHHDDGSVATPDGYREAYQAYVEGGWGTLAQSTEQGGQGLPHVLAAVFQEYMSSACMAFAMFPGLAQGAVAAIDAFGTDEQKKTYLPHMISGQWAGTMNLTEPQCGTDLGLIQSRAEPEKDGSWKLTGNKIFISGGEHDLTENIIHLVLAKTPGAPDTARGISLFIVPKFLPKADGTPGKRNALSCGSIEHKMGIHGNPTCVMNYDGATAFLLGKEMEGLKAMFVMMNAARLGVGCQGLSQAEVAMQNAAAYARERLQGRALSGPKNPDGPADPLLVHPDVRRMLLDGRAFTEGGRALYLWVALQVDLAAAAATAAEREAADDLLSLLTPVIKAWCTEEGYRQATNAQQVFGGHGYITEWGMEQFVRDARITMIYEGANGIQALDLVGRKLARHGGRALRTFLALVGETVAAGQADERLQPLAEALAGARKELEGATMWLMENAMAAPDNGAAGSMAYLRLLAIVAVGHCWLRMAAAALADDSGDFNAEFLEAKFLTARHFFEQQGPMAAAHAARVKAGAATMMAFPDSAF